MIQAADGKKDDFFSPRRERGLRKHRTGSVIGRKGLQTNLKDTEV